MTKVWRINFAGWVLSDGTGEMVLRAWEFLVIHYVENTSCMTLVWKRQHVWKAFFLLPSAVAICSLRFEVERSGVGWIDKGVRELGSRLRSLRIVLNDRLMEIKISIQINFLTPLIDSWLVTRDLWFVIHWHHLLNILRICDLSLLKVSLHNSFTTVSSPK